MRRTVSRSFWILVAPAFAAWLAVAGGVAAAEKTLSWDDDACHNTIRFDPAKYDEMRLRNTVRLLFGPSDFQPPIAMVPFDPPSIARMDLEESKRKCSMALERARSTPFIPLNGIERYRRAKVAELQDWCNFESAKIRGFRDPSALRDYQPAAAACSSFIDALEGRTDIMAVFRETLDRNCSRNAAPAACVAKFVGQSQRPDGMDWVRVYLTGFGWNNCAHKFTIMNAGVNEMKQMLAGLEGEFTRLFKITKERCDSQS